MKTELLVDSSFLYALFNPRDRNHASAARFMSTTNLQPIIPIVTIPEACYLFLRDWHFQAVELFMSKLVKSQVPIQQITMDDLAYAHQIMRQYADVRFDVVDTIIMALSERMKISNVATFDRRDFSVYRPQNTAYLTLLP